MSHVGMLPHHVHHYGGFKSQGHTVEAALKIVDNARAIEEAGAVGIEVEAMPYEVGRAVEQAVSIFTFFIGAGAAGSCQALNAYDLIGSFDSFKPMFVKRYGNVTKVAIDALEAFAQEVRSGEFPDASHSYKMNPGEAEKLAAALNKT
jgi:3-methyl-2-oxobutanoate hydroxymethyltransferase